MTELRQRMIADMTSAGLAPTSEAFAVLLHSTGARPIS